MDDRTDQTESTAGRAADSADDAPDPNASGLRDPARAARSLAAMLLALEALVLLLALAPLNMLGVRHLGLAVTAVLVLTAAAVVLAGMMRRGWAWHAGTALQILVLPCGFFHWALTAVGVVFLAAWLYVLHVRRVLARPPVRDPESMPPRP